MALRVGELVGFIRLDDGQVRPALTRTEGALTASGRRMANDAEAAGQRAGRALGGGVADGADAQMGSARRVFGAAGQRAGHQLGDGIVRGADGRLRDARGHLVSEGQRAGAGFGDGATAGARGGLNGLPTVARQSGRRAGDELGDGLADGADVGADGAVAAAEGGLSKLKVAAAGIGVAAGAMLMEGMTRSLEQSQIAGRLGAQLGKTPAEARRYGKIAGAMYANAVTEDFQTAADAIQATMRSGLMPPGATNRQIESISTKVADLAQTFELDLGQTANAVGQIMKTGLAKNSKEALDVITRGLQVMGPRADDIADTFNEYSTIFRSMGLDAKTATGLLSQGMKAGARDTDVVADAVKEFSIEAVAGGDRVRDGFESLGMNADEMVGKFAKGGPTAAKAFDQVLDTLRGIEDPAERNAVAIELFGTKAEDLGDALWALDPSKAVKDLGEVGGAAEKMGDTLRDNAGVAVEQFRRGAMQRLVDFLGGTAIPALLEFRGFVGRTFGGMWAEAGKGSDGAVDRIIGIFAALGERLRQKAVELAPKAIEGLMAFGGRVADFIVANPEKVLKIGLISAALVAAIVALPILIAAALSVAAATMMFGFVKEMGTALVENLPTWWNSLTGWLAEKSAQTGALFRGLGTAIGSWFGSLWSQYIAGPVSRTWTSLIASVAALPARTVGALASLGGRLTATSLAAWQRFRDAAASRATAFLSWVAGLPGRISSGIGSLGSLLYGKGQDVVRGLWRGIQSMGSWLRSTLSGWARNLVPGPIAKALGISSPSKVMAQQVGRWIPEGIIQGIESGQGALDRTMAGLVQPSPLPGPGTPGLAGGGDRQGRTARVEIASSGSRMDDLLLETLRQAVRVRGGDVQLVLGR